MSEESNERIIRALEARGADGWCARAATRLRELEAENQRLRESRRGLVERAYIQGYRDGDDEGMVVDDLYEPWIHRKRIDALLAEEPSDVG